MVRPNEWVQEVRRETRSRLEWDWDSYTRDLGISPERIAVGRGIAERLEQAVAERQMPWQIQFRKGYFALQRAGGYNVAVVDLYWRTPPRVSVKIPASPQSLGLRDPFPDLPGRWSEADREWEWQVPSVDAIPDVGKALDLVRRFHESTGPMVDSSDPPPSTPPIVDAE